MQICFLTDKLKSIIQQIFPQDLYNKNVVGICRAIRYEDLCADPYQHIQNLFEFFGLFYHPAVSKFLDLHTKKNVGGVSSTTRDTRSAPFLWRSKLNFSEVQYIEENCDQAMKLWGYVKASNESHLREFNPLTNYTIQWVYTHSSTVEGGSLAKRQTKPSCEGRLGPVATPVKNNRNLTSELTTGRRRLDAVWLAVGRRTVTLVSWFLFS